MPTTDRPRRTARAVAARYGDRPVEVAELLRSGFTRGQLRAALGAGALARVRRGVLAAVPPRDPRAQHLAQVRAELLTRGQAVACGLSAARAHRLPSPLPREYATGNVELMAARGQRTARLVVRSGRLDPVDVVSIEGIPCTSLARTALDVARGRPLPQALVVLDAALRRLILSCPEAAGAPADVVTADVRLRAWAHEELRAALARCRERRFAPALAVALERADASAETALESASRGLLHVAGLPSPELQIWVRGDDGRWYRCDMGWREQRVLGEADGRVKYRTPEDLWEEKRRQEAILGTGDWTRLVRWTSTDVWRGPDTFLARVARALASA